MVDSINKSGQATASVGDDGKLTITSATSDKLTFSIGDGDRCYGRQKGRQQRFRRRQHQRQARPGQDTSAVTGADLRRPAPSAQRSSSQFNDLRTQIDQLAKDASYNGVNLLTGDKLSVVFNEKTGTNQNKLDVQGQTIDSETLGIKNRGLCQH